MQQVFKEEKIVVSAGKKFHLKNYTETLTIDEEGRPIKLDHDTSSYRGGGYCSRTPKDSSFDSFLRTFMENLLKEDKSEFRLLRDSLNGEYRQMAENIRKSAADEYNF